MGEFTIASLAAFQTFPTYIEYIKETQAYPAAAVSLLSFAITWAAMLALLVVGRGRAGRRLAAARRARAELTSSCRACAASSAP